MNRMWVRLSLVIGTLLVFVTLLPLLTYFLIEWNQPEPFYDPALDLDFDSLTLEEMEYLEEMQYFPEEPFLFGLSDRDTLLWSLGISVALALLAGVWLSRSISRPVGKLVEAAQAIGRHEFEHRVEVHSSQEIEALASSFNSMATQLGRAEQIRHNLMADVAHELRTPITVLEGNLRAILDGVYAPNNAEIGLLYNQTRHLNRLVNDLHLLAQAEADQLTLDAHLTDIGSLIQDAVDFFEVVAQEQNIQLGTEIESSLPQLNVDPRRLRQVVDNLLANSLKHTPSGGKIIVRVNAISTEMTLQICDTGKGISNRDLPHLFERFYRTDHDPGRDSGGAGLGLAIVKAIITSHGGRVEVSSKGLHQGSQFSIYLPISSPS